MQPHLELECTAMTHVYLVKADGSSEPMARLHCADEAKELQELLAKNLELLPGDQIDPDDPRRWLLVKREMPVPDPGTGGNRWSVDFLLLDQDAIPTFVECKRFEDTRSRREVVGQVLEYAANGQFYWSKELLRGLAETAAKDRGLGLEQALELLRPNESLSADAFFERAEENLRQGQVRLVFLLEESPVELRSVVLFLNGQMERSEVLLVEARQYVSEGRRVVVPSLFGYTEQARLIKRAVTVTSAGSRRKWDKGSFFADAASKLEPHEVQALSLLYDRAASSGCDIAWGTGKDNGSFNIKDTRLFQRSLFSVYSNGTLSVNFAWLNETERAQQARDRLRQLLSERLQLAIPADYAQRFLTMRVGDWAPKSAHVADALEQLLTEFRGAD
ncbi:MAG TPA: hypothetical protein VNL98_12120 [Gemmatimonadales bacterium]|nr:hypothetical protein [Gemmatimonadales bacterium]